MNNEATNPEFDHQRVQAWFKHESLLRLAESLKQQTYPGYPANDMRMKSHDLSDNGWGEFIIPGGPWWVKPEDYWDDAARDSQPHVRDIDSRGRPLHPWFLEMVTDPDIGVLAGKGFYWHWGPNYTADPIIIREDLEVPHVLLIRRRDTASWALPGGFVDQDECAVDAALREAHEEASLDLRGFDFEQEQVYSGPLADLRATAHAWPETSAYLFRLTEGDFTRLPPMPYQGNDDAEKAGWFPLEMARQGLFGSHGLLLELAAKRL